MEVVGIWTDLGGGCADLGSCLHRPWVEGCGLWVGLLVRKVAAWQDGQCRMRWPGDDFDDRRPTDSGIQ